MFQVLNVTHPPILETITLHWPDEAACAQTARSLARDAALGDAVLTLSGDLGAGKTTFTRHLLQALGVQGRIKSPTYAVMEVHEVRDQGLSVFHFDFYRFRDPQEWEDAGFRDVFAAPGLKVCEWPDRAEGLMPPPDLALLLSIGPGEARQVRLEAFSARGVALLRAARGEKS